jgi:hypothetical protein
VPELRVVVAEDAVVLRDGLVGLLDAYGHEVVAAVADAGALLAAVAEHAPDVTVVDIRMPPTHTDEGLRAAVTLRRTSRPQRRAAPQGGPQCGRRSAAGGRGAAMGGPGWEPPGTHAPKAHGNGSFSAQPSSLMRRTRVWKAGFGE